MKNIDIAGLALQFLGWVAVVTLPIHHTLVAVSCLVLADFITGVWASIKEKKQITSNKFRNTISKLLGYSVMILVCFIMEQYLLNGIPVVKAVTAMIGVTEGKSFFENIHRITGIDFWTQLISKLNLQDIKNQDSDKLEK